MAGKIYERKKIQGMIALAHKLFDDFKDAGMVQQFPTNNMNLTVMPTTTELDFIFDSSPAMNPLNATQPWRLLLRCKIAGVNNPGNGHIKIAIANPQQINPADTATNALKFTTSFPASGTDTPGARIMGQLGNAWTPSGTPAAGAHFITREASSGGWDLGTVYSYTLVFTDHGMSLCVWEDADEISPNFSWFVVQFPVDKETGAPLTTDQSPLFCVYSADNMYIRKFIINESDVFRPTQAVDAVRDTLNSSAIINAEEQVAIAKGNRYLVTFPNRINTERYAYTEELDMFAYTSADVIAEESEIPVTVYGEASPRVYRAMKANGPNNTKMRLMFLVQGGGGPAVNPD